MKKFLNLLIVLAMTAVFSSCSKQSDAGLITEPKFDAKPQVKDVLHGKSNAEVLTAKYKELKATCSLNAVKTTKGQFSAMTTGITPAPPPVPENPISNPTENSFSYDLKLQQIVDKELSEDVTSKLSITKDGQILQVNIKLKGIKFAESLNVDNNNKKYIMKHSPVLSYLLDYKLVHDPTAAIVGKSEGHIYEKIADQKNAFVTLEIGPDQYNFVLECQLKPQINPENPELAAEFENQWAEVDCHDPKNDAEREVCKL